MATMGRPREFDYDQALDQALEVFWRNGYEGSSIAELTHAMGISAPSLYAAFGNKEGLFRKALDRYVERRTAFWQEAEKAPTARGMIEHLLKGTVDFLTDASNPAGCMLVRGAMSCSVAADAIARELTARRAEGEIKLRERLKQGRATDEVPPEIDPRNYARYIMAVLEGMSVRAAGGADRKELQNIAEIAMRSWPARVTDAAGTT
jgi:AcrR family transcriptional regulator